ncbi:MAG TPA: hypothetical protein VFT90_11560, partial [Chryseosolibacter sp.]|nr:hypothetical protein [Chryseosolibacter sp.]
TPVTLIAAFAIKFCANFTPLGDAIVRGTDSDTRIKMYDGCFLIAHRERFLVLAAFMRLDRTVIHLSDAKEFFASYTRTRDVNGDAQGETPVTLIAAFAIKFFANFAPLRDANVHRLPEFIAHSRGFSDG